ncbi:MAG: hypothetical protein K1000chlam2_00744 [Chlamydiae bacterium]|nr:hypothetical protein [Chlamydiota bacterium]
MNNITDTTNRPFHLLPAEATANILSFVDVKDHGKAAQVNKLFNAIVNSGVEEGKNAQEYLLGKIGKFDFSFTKEDLRSLIAKAIIEEAKPRLKPEFKNLPEFQNSIFTEISEIITPYSETIYPEMQGKFKEVVIDNIKEFISQDGEVSNLKLAQFVQDPNCEKSQAFIKDLALKMLEKITSTDEKREEFGLQPPLHHPEVAAKLFAFEKKYLIEQPITINFTKITIE